MQPPEDPYRSVWNMTPVGGTEGGRKRTELKIIPGVLAAIVVLVPFGVLAGYLWAAGAATAAWVVMLVGLAGAFSMGAFVASDRS